MIVFKIILWTYLILYVIGCIYVMFSGFVEADKAHEENVKKRLEDN